MLEPTAGRFTVEHRDVAFSAISCSPRPGESPRLKRQYRPLFHAEFAIFRVYFHPIVILYR